MTAQPNTPPSHPPLLVRRLHPDATDAWLELLAPGDVARLVLRGQWAQAQLLWRGGCGELWLWADCRSDAEWLIRRGALRLLHTEHLVQPLQPRSLLAEARAKAARAVTATRSAA